MKIYKDGQHRLFENDAETAGVVSRMLLELERDRMDAVRKYSRQFDGWDPPAFRLSRQQIEEAIQQLPEQAIRDTEFCQANVRAFAQAQLDTLRPLEVETRPV
jgi:sulfopropanediol 3-dehydrogenase